MESPSLRWLIFGGGAYIRNGLSVSDYGGIIYTGEVLCSEVYGPGGRLFEARLVYLHASVQWCLNYFEFVLE